MDISLKKTEIEYKLTPYIIIKLTEIYNEINNILSDREKFKGKTKKHLPKIHDSKTIRTDINNYFVLENFIEKYRLFSFLISDERSIEQLFEYVKNTLEMRYNMVRVYNTKGKSYIETLLLKHRHGMNIYSPVHFRNYLCSYTTQKDILSRFPYFLDTRNDRCYYKKVYTIFTSNSHKHLIKKNRKIILCNLILICIDHNNNYHIMFDFDENKTVTDELIEFDLDEEKEIIMPILEDLYEKF